MTIRIITLSIALGFTDEGLQWPDHDIRSRLPYGVDFGPRLDDLARQLGQVPGSIVISSGAAFDAEAPGLTVRPAITDGRIVSVEIADGTAGSVAVIGLVATTADGHVLRPVRVQLAVVDRMAGLLPVTAPVPANDDLPTLLAAAF